MAINPSGAALSRAMSAVMQLKAQLVGYDEDDILASIESETNAIELLDRLLESALADKAIINAARDRIERIEQRANHTRAMLKAMIEEIGKVERPLATLSLANAPAQIGSIDENALPDEFWRRSVDKVALVKALRAGDTVPGATLNNPERQLRITTR